MASIYRVTFFNILDFRGYVSLDEIFFYDAFGNVINFPTVGTATAVSYASNAYPSRVLPSNYGYWQSGTITQTMLDNGDVWWRYSFNADNICIYGYKFKIRDSYLWREYTPTKWALEVYNNRKNLWELLDFRENVVWESRWEAKYFTCSNTLFILNNLNRMSSNSSYIFRNTASGVVTYNNNYEYVGIIPLDSCTYIFTAIWASDEYLYIGTTSSGVLRIPITSISGGNYTDFQLYKTYPELTSPDIVDIHGEGDYICIATSSGVNEINISTSANYYTTATGISRCFQTLSGIYYILGDTLCSVYDVNSNWSTPNYLYNKHTHIAFYNVDYINDLYVEDGIIYLATNNGVIIIKEARGFERVSEFMRFRER